MNILLTGVTGFLGSRIATTLSVVEGIRLRAAVRRPTEIPEVELVEVRELDANTDWSGALACQQIVIHTAARAHIMSDEVADPLTEYRRVNVDGTLNLAYQAAAEGVKRFIFISSIKVNGEQTPHGIPFTADDVPAPEDPYGISKWEAEQGLRQIALETGMEIVIIRPPLVYGPGVKGNFASMIKMVEKGLPLPLGAIHNQRSLVGVDNLVDLIVTCIDHADAANQVFLAGDGCDLSTTALLQGVAKAMGRPSRVIPVPSGMLKLAATVLGKRAIADRLLGSLQVDISKTEKFLGWHPPVGVDEGLRRCFTDPKIDAR